MFAFVLTIDSSVEVPLVDSMSSGTAGTTDLFCIEVMELTLDRYCVGTSAKTTIGDYSLMVEVAGCLSNSDAGGGGSEGLVTSETVDS